MKRRFDIEIVERPTVPTIAKMMPVYMSPLSRLRDVRLIADTRWMQSVFERHGTSDGIIWIALQDPALFSRIRYAFTTAKTFLHFVYTTPDAIAREKARIEEKRKRIQRERVKR